MTDIMGSGGQVHFRITYGVCFNYCSAGALKIVLEIVGLVDYIA